MGVSASFDMRLAERFDTLSARLQMAGEYVSRNPVDVATRSLRAVSEDTGLAPATFTRLAQALDYPGFEDLRADVRLTISRQINNFADRAERLQQEHGGESSDFFSAHTAACLANIQNLEHQIDTQQLNRAVDHLYAAKQVVVLGALGATGAAEYLSYLAEFCVPNWRLASRMGSSVGATISELGPQDGMIVVTKPPFSATVLRAAKLAHAQGVYVLVITDTPRCPALRNCSASFLVPTESPHFYSSFAATTVLIEAMIGQIVSRAGPEAQARIATIEESNRRLKIVSDG